MSPDDNASLFSPDNSGKPSFENGEAWQQISASLLKRLGKTNFERSFAGASARRNGTGPILIQVAGPISQLWIEQNFAGQLNDAIAEVLGEAIPFDFEVSANGSGEGVVLRASGKSSDSEKLSAREITTKGRPSRAYVSEPDDLERRIASSGLNPKFRFENFVVGPNSSYSAAVAKNVAEKPGRVYNPLFFYGGTGLGKTHLMQAIGRAVLEHKRKAVVRYVTSETFTNEFIEAIKKNDLVPFRQKYRQVDVLAIDDVQFFEKKDSTQEEFFHTFNDLFNNAKQIVLASDRPPSAIKHLESRLVSRFDWGLTTQIQTPDLETRIAILDRKAADHSATIPGWVKEFIARRVRNNVRKLEGALMRVAAQFSLEGNISGEAQLTQMLHDVIEEEPSKSVTIDRVQRAVASEYDLRIADLTGPRRTKMIAEARQVAMFLTRTLTRLPLVQIGEEFGNRDHGTVIHAFKVVTKRKESDEDLRERVEKLSQGLIEA
jgi:chromosomal replication initiator protein